MFAPTPSHINEADLRRNLREFSRKMRCKWHFRNEVPQNNEEISQFKVKSQWNPPKGHPALEAFLNKTEKDIFSLIPEREKNYNLTKDEYLTMRSLENDRNVTIKPADKVSSIVVRDRFDYLAEAEKQLSDSNTYKEVKLSEKDQVKLVEKSNSMFEGLKKKTATTEKREKLLVSLILKRLITSASYIFYREYIRGTATYRDAPLFRTVVPP